MDRLRKIITNALLAFVMISIGFALGRNTARHSPASSANQSQDTASGLIVYYTHGLIRCPTCNNIEKSTHAILEHRFKGELDSGMIRWQVVDFQEDEAFAKKFDVTASGVILAVMQGGKVTEVIKLDKVWELIDAPGKFDDYIANAIRVALSDARARQKQSE